MVGVTDDHSTDTPLDLAYHVTKILAPLLLFCLTLAFGLCPILIVKPHKRKTDGGQTHASKIISFTACVGGGVLLATALIHILPEARSGFERWSNRSHEAHHHHGHGPNDTKHDDELSHDHTFPWIEFVVCLGFLIVYLVDELIHACLGHKSHINEDHGHSHSPQVIQCATNGEQVSNAGSKPYSHFTVFNQMESGMAHVEAKQKALVSIGGLITVAALSFHSIFEGLSLGLQNSAGKTWLLTLAIATHKLVIAFVVGFELCATGYRKIYVMVYIFIFSIMSPIGAFLGVVAQTLIKENTLLVAVLNAFASGTLLFVVFVEVLQKQKNTSLHGLLQLTAVAIGFFMMILLGFLVASLPHLESESPESFTHALNETLHDHHGHSH